MVETRSSGMPGLVVLLLGALTALMPPNIQAQQGAGAKAAVAPAGLDSVSLARIPLAKREDIKTDEEKKVYDRLTKLSPPPKVGIGGPTNLRLYFPIVAEHYRDAVRWLRENCGVEPGYVELAILVAARESSGQYEFLAHVEGARNGGIPASTIDVVREKKDTQGLEPKADAVIRLGREMVRTPKVTSKTFADMEKLFGRRGTLALAMLISHYSASSMLLHTYDSHLAPDQTPPFPAP